MAVHLSRRRLFWVVELQTRQVGSAIDLAPIRGHRGVHLRGGEGSKGSTLPLAPICLRGPVLGGHIDHLGASMPRA